MKVEITKDIKEPYAIIYTNELSKEIKDIVETLEQVKENAPVLLGKKEDKFLVLDPKDIYMVRVEDSEAILYGEKERYISNKRLCEVEALLGKGFLRISKTTIVNLIKMDSVETSFQGMMLYLKNGCKDYISRKYLPEFKKYLGL